MKIHHFNPKKEKRGVLYQVFVVVAIVQISLLLVFGSYVVTRTILEDEAKFTPPETVQPVDHARQEHRVNMERQQKKTSKFNRRISIQNPQNVNTPEVKINLPAAITSGGGISTISEKTLKTDIKIAVPSIELMGLKSRAEKILICVDASSYLMNEERGGLDTYKVIREDIKNLINGLPSTALFNLMVFDTTHATVINFFQSNLVAATSFNKKLACTWIEPFNADLKSIGAGRNNYTLKYDFIPQPPNSQFYKQDISNVYRIYQAALEQGAEAIWILTTNWVDPDRLKYPWTDAETERFHKAQERYENEKEKLLKAAGWDDDKQQEYERAEKEAYSKGIKQARDWIAKENAKRAAKGVPLYTGTPVQAMNENNLKPKVSPSPPNVKAKAPEAKFKSYGRSGIFKYYQKLFKEVYFDKQMKPPTVNMIVFRGKKEEWTSDENKVVRAFTSANNGGKSRVLRGLQPVSEYN